MVERFTDRSRRVMQLAYQEAARLNHDVINTSHLLLALLKEGSGAAAYILQNAGLSLRSIREQAGVIYGPVAAAKEPVEGKLPQTPRLKTVLSMAMDCAKDLHLNHVDTEHLLVGLLREGQGTACQILANLNIVPSRLKDEILSLLDKKLKKRDVKLDDDFFQPLPTQDELRTAANGIEVLCPWYMRLLLNGAADKIDRLQESLETVAAESGRQIVAQEQTRPCLELPAGDPKLPRGGFF